SGTKLRMSSVALATSVTLFHRFNSSHDTKDIDVETVAATLLYLSGKIEEESLRLRDVINVSHRILNPKDQLLEVDSKYFSLKDSLIQTELYLLRALKFNVSVDHPHKYLVHYLKGLYDWLDKSTTSTVPIAHFCWALLMDSYHSEKISLAYKPNIVALSIIYTVLRVFNVNVPYNDQAETQWWEAFCNGVTLKELKEVGLELMNIYDVETKVPIVID
ncbi:hypothetical protein HELRODRAFT_92276, partial [Helobdella robusta]|uniref:Cyclin N-terminal domain-containing protein n=1 Tax=Helobdella robusta TaxID=6412 RepID=T1G8D7_HELRO